MCFLQLIQSNSLVLEYKHTTAILDHTVVCLNIKKAGIQTFKTFYKQLEETYLII